MEAVRGWVWIFSGIAQLMLWIIDMIPLGMTSIPSRGGGGNKYS